MPSFVARLASSLLVAAALLAPAARADEPKVLRLGLSDIAYLDPQQITDLYSTRVANVIFEGLYEFDYLATPARVVPNTAVGDARDHRRRPHLDDPHQAGNPVRRRPGVQGQAARAGRRRTTSIRSSGGSTPTSSAAAIRPSPTCWSARGRSSTRRRKPASSTTTRRSTACRRSIATRCACKLTAGRLHDTGAARRRLAPTPSRARRSKRPATR